MNKLRHLKYIFLSIIKLIADWIRIPVSKFRKKNKELIDYRVECNRLTIFYLRQKLSFSASPAFILTVKCIPHQGAGVHAYLIMSAMSFAHLLQTSYAHTRFSTLFHADRPMDEYAQRWEDYFNLGFEELPATDDKNVVNYSLVMQHMRQLYGLTDLHSGFVSQIPKIKYKYNKNKNKTVEKSDALMVCIHVRRGDVTPNYANHLWTPDEEILTTIKQLKSQLDGYDRPYELHLFSQGERREFSSFEGLDIQFQLDRDPIWSHSCMVEADVLVTAKSTYSYTAALLSDNLVIMERFRDAFWNPCLQDWVVKNPDGSFDQNKFDSLFNQKCGPKNVA